MLQKLGILSDFIHIFLYLFIRLVTKNLQSKFEIENVYLYFRL